MSGMCFCYVMPRIFLRQVVWRGLSFLILISCPCFAAIKEGGKNNSSVYLDFGCLWDVSLIPHILVELAKGCTCFCESGVHLVIHDNREGAAEVGELFYHLQSLSLDSDVGLDIWFSLVLAGASLQSFCADGLAKIVTGHHCFACWFS